LLDEAEQALTQIAIQLNEEGVGLAAATLDKRLVSARYLREESFISEEVTTELESRSELTLKNTINAIALTPTLDHLYAASDDGTLLDFSLDEDGFDGEQASIKFKHEITRLQLLLGGASLMVGLDNGEVQQWMSVRKDSGRELTFIRAFHENSNKNTQPVTFIATEQQRKGFAVADSEGDITLYYSTSHRTLANINTADTAIEQMAWSARAQHLLATDDKNQMYLYFVHNEYPEVSWDVLWDKVWYEGYDEADYLAVVCIDQRIRTQIQLDAVSFWHHQSGLLCHAFCYSDCYSGVLFLPLSSWHHGCARQ